MEMKEIIGGGGGGGGGNKKPTNINKPNSLHVSVLKLNSLYLYIL